MREITIQLDDGPSTLPVDESRPATPIYSPGEALEAHLRMLSWIGTAKGQELFEALYKSTPMKPGRDRAETVMFQKGIFWAALDMAETIYVSPDMVRLTMALAEEQGEHTPILHLTDLPAPAGLVLFGGDAPGLPYLGSFSDPDNSELVEFSRTRGFMWRVCKPGPISFTIDGQNFEMIGDDNTPMSRVSEHGGVIMWDVYDAGQYLLGPNSWVNKGRPPFLPTRTTAYAFDTQEEWDNENAGPKVRRFVGTLLRLMWQRILSPEEWHPPRSLARRAHHAKHMPEDGSAIKVTHLRRYEPGWETEPSEAPGERGPMHYTVVVKGHWRDQWYPSLGPARIGDGDWNEDSHRRIWIDPHLRGQGPLVLKHSLTAVVR